MCRRRTSELHGLEFERSGCLRPEPESIAASQTGTRWLGLAGLHFLDLESCLQHSAVDVNGCRRRPQELTNQPR